LRPEHFAVLGALTERSARSQSRLREVLAVHPGDFVAIIEDLLQRGLVTRGVDQIDRRRRPIAITKRGRELVSRATTESERVAARILQDLEQGEQATVIRLLRQALDDL
jgi:DNA-binding MarR family transcriptional regulator